MAQQLVEFLPHLHYTTRSLFRNYHVPNFVTICLPIGLRNSYGASQVRTGKLVISKGYSTKRDTDDCIFSASSTRIAFLMLPPESSMILSATSSGRVKQARLATYCMTDCICICHLDAENFRVTDHTCSWDGAATRMRRQRLRIGAMRRLVLFAHSMMRKLFMYFSIVRRRAAWASRDRESASLMMTTNRGVRNYKDQVRNVDTFEPLFRI